jgi:two-component system response regulator MprA
MSHHARVLVVDNDADIRDLIEMVLVDDGYTVETASDGADALRKVGEHEPNAIILDAMMPRMNGWEFLALWCTRPAGDRPPVLMISAVGNRRTAMDAGAQGFLAKPFDLDALEATLASVL